MSRRYRCLCHVLFYINQRKLIKKRQKKKKKARERVLHEFQNFAVWVCNQRSIGTFLEDNSAANENQRVELMNERYAVCHEDTSLRR